MNFDINLTFFALVMFRLFGCIMFNPIFGRRNLPLMLRSGLVLVLTILVCQAVPAQNVEINNILIFTVVAIKEMLLGFIIGLIMRMFFSIVAVGGEAMDMQIGLSMAKAYDPQSESNNTISTSILNLMYMMIFFTANGHYTLMRIFMELAEFVPYGEFSIEISSFEQIFKLFSLILVYSVKMFFPVLAVELVTEIGVGILMKAVPQINVFIINLQLKVMLGLLTILLLVPTFAAFFDRMTELMFDQIHNIIGI